MTPRSCSGARLRRRETNDRASPWFASWNHLIPSIADFLRQNKGIVQKFEGFVLLRKRNFEFFGGVMGKKGTALRCCSNFELSVGFDVTKRCRTNS